MIHPLIQSRSAMRLFSLILFFAVCVPTIAVRAEVTADAVHQQREAFVHDFAQTVVTILQDPKKKYDDRKDMLRNAFAMSVDIDWIARFVLGASWNRATDEQKERYVSLYRRYLTESYVANFAENPDKRIRDIKVQDVNNSDTDASNFRVRTEMVLVDWETLKVSYLVNEQEGRYKVRDIAIENVSLINTHRAELGAIAATRGIAEVIAKLEAAISQDRPTITLSMK